MSCPQLMPLPWAALLVFDEAEGLGGRPALDLGYSAASNVVEAEPLKGLTAFLTERLCVSWCRENVSLVSKFRTASYFFFVVGPTLGRACYKALSENYGGR